MDERIKDAGDTLEYAFQWYDWLRGSDVYWKPSSYYSLGDTATPQRHASNGRRYRCTIAGRTATSPPTWPTSSTPVTDGGAQWTLIGNEDRIASSDWTADAALTLTSESVDATLCVTQVTIAGGTAGQSYVVKDAVTTNAGRIAERSFVLKVRDL
jgi:hypothetical protein